MCIYYVPNIGTVPRNRFRSHHPHDDSGDGGFYFDNADELLNHNFVKGFSRHDGFFRYAVSTDNALMAEYKNGKEWWPIGRVKDTSYLGLPNWEPKK
jgi:hypothetical protein